jgi:hypothetical protein
MFRNKSEKGFPSVILPYIQGGHGPIPASLKPPTGGLPLANPVKGKMEHVFNADFSDVRIHIGQEASSIGSVAFTWGSNIYFAPGRYQPNTFQGQRMLGHELTHVVQQRNGRAKSPYSSGATILVDPILENEADQCGLIAAHGNPAPIQTRQLGNNQNDQMQHTFPITGRVQTKIFRPVIQMINEGKHVRKVMNDLIGAEWTWKTAALIGGLADEHKDWSALELFAEEGKTNAFYAWILYDKPSPPNANMNCYEYIVYTAIQSGRASKMAVRKALIDTIAEIDREERWSLDHVLSRLFETELGYDPSHLLWDGVVNGKPVKGSLEVPRGAIVFIDGLKHVCMGIGGTRVISFGIPEHRVNIIDLAELVTHCIESPPPNNAFVGGFNGDVCFSVDPPMFRKYVFRRRVIVPQWQPGRLGSLEVERRDYPPDRHPYDS